MESTLALQSTHIAGLEFALSLFAVIAGFVSIIILFEKKNNVIPGVRAGVTFIMYGIFSIVIATIWDVFFIYMKSAPRYFEDIHPLFIGIGMICFIVAAVRFSSDDTSLYSR